MIFIVYSVLSFLQSVATFNAFATNGAFVVGFFLYSVSMLVATGLIFPLIFFFTLSQAHHFPFMFFFLFCYFPVTYYFFSLFPAVFIPRKVLNTFGLVVIILDILPAIVPNARADQWV